MAREANPSRPAPSLIDKQSGAIDDRKPNGTGERSGMAATASPRGERAEGRDEKRDAGRAVKRDAWRQASRIARDDG